MYLKEITYLLGIKEYRSITKAAEELYISQPALSKFLKNVEKQVGAPLFSRIGNELVPTHIGNRYLEYAAKIAGLQSDWNLERSDLLGEEKGRISIMVPPARSSCIMPYVMPRFWQKYPHVEVTLKEESYLVLKQLESSRDIDFVISGETDPAPGLVHEPLGREEIVLIMAEDHPFAEMGMVRPDCRYPWIDLYLLQNESFVLNPRDQTTGKVSARLLEQAGISPNVLLYTRNTDVAVRLAAAGSALAFAPETYVKQVNFVQSPRCFSIGGPKSEIYLYASYKHGRYLSSYAKYFLDLIREYMGQAVRQ